MPDPEPIRYRLSIVDPREPLYAVEMRLPDLGTDLLELAMPAWIPGSYMIRSFARNVRAFEPRDAAGRPLPWEKADKQTWRVRLRRPGPCVVRYRVYAFDLSPRGSHVDDTHAYWNGPSVFLYVAGRTDLPCRLETRAPRGWRVHTALPAEPGGGRPGAFRAPSYDALVDAPGEAGRARPWTFPLRGRPFSILLHGRSEIPKGTILRDVRKIAETQAKIFGGVPFARYLLLVHVLPEGGGGLEHADSASLGVPPEHLEPGPGYARFLHLVSHELFHLWNVKRIRPAVFDRFDYAREVHTSLLWAMEGITDYYAALAVRRAGLSTPRELLDRYALALDRLENVPGRKVQSLAEASHDAWTHYYDRTEDLWNRTVSYYEKGAWVGLLLDLEIRRRSQGRLSLDDLHRRLLRECAENGGLAENGFQRTLEAMAGESYADFFKAYVYGTEDPPAERPLASVGLALRRKERPRIPDPSWLGLAVERAPGAARVGSVRTGSAAAAAGVAPRDEIVAVESLRCDGETFAKRLAAYRSPRTVRLALFRRGELREVPVRIPPAPPGPWRIVPRPNATAAQRRAFCAWLGAVWNEKI